MAFEGSCHCGAVKFTVDGDIPTEAIDCNCSHCRRKGFLWSFLPAEKFTLDQGEDSLTTYTFNTHKLKHRFCSTCGVQGFAEGLDKDRKETRAVNLRAVPECDLEVLKITKFDGASK
jgi:hypothetical protein